MRRATARSSLSPMPCPKVSLMRLKVIEIDEEEPDAALAMRRPLERMLEAVHRK
jgi:hypothetical protein